MTFKPRSRKQNSEFRRGSGVYRCTDCGAQTRETGSGESHSRLCAICFEAASLYNLVQDGEMEQAEFAAELVTLGYKGKEFAQE